MSEVARSEGSGGRERKGRRWKAEAGVGRGRGGKVRERKGRQGEGVKGEAEGAVRRWMICMGNGSEHSKASFTAILHS